MKTLCKIVISLAAAAALTACATGTTGVVTPAPGPEVPCELMSWSECGTATHCGPARTWEGQDGAMAETWACERRYEPTVPGFYTASAQ